MPTDDAMLSPSVEHEGHLAGRTTCPPEESRASAPHDLTNDNPLQADDGVRTPRNPPAQQPTPPPGDAESSSSRASSAIESQPKRSEADIETPIRDIPTPMSATEEGADEQRNSHVSPLSATSSAAPVSPSQSSHLAAPSPSHRYLPNSTSSLLRPGSRFKGSQISDRQQYEVEVEIKYVDMRESFLCGYLRIKGLTEDHPSLTTYFEGEIIGNKYTFITQHPEWGSNDKVDRQHWARFPAYKPLAKYSGRPELITKDWMQKEHLFMRWKEYFLVPDHRVRTINGASFEGFYYICFNQVSGSIEGIYFHAKSEK
ncbi:hypothetical protein BS50DRAFT_653656 [Corynespora cassiicola Philippines]|uniref:Vacuolar import and degradation protein n=1 Tax=Corynespora cassiicola Philippines TaxID=1448308 RepID=A0A2T2P789_CORCC|nr:hypothetical protein BS50DRAFT_653656 [Corynespora cassiicola Philippines]